MCHGSELSLAPARLQVAGGGCKTLALAGGGDAGHKGNRRQHAGAAGGNGAGPRRAWLQRNVDLWAAAHLYAGSAAPLALEVYKRVHTGSQQGNAQPR